MSLLSVKETLKNLSPPWVRASVRETYKAYRKVRNRFQPKFHRQDNIFECLRELGIQPGDHILVHSSLSRLGQVEGGAEAVVAALQRSVADTGTIGAPTFWTIAPALEPSNVYRVAEAPSKLGIISETIRRLPGAQRSLHPTHCASFVGTKAQELTCEHHLDRTPVGPHSPYMKLAEIGGKIVMLGVSLEYLTSFHTIEDLVQPFPVTIYAPNTRQFVVQVPGRGDFEVECFLHAREASKMRLCTKMEPHLEQAGVIRKRPFGFASIAVLDAPLLHKTLMRLCEQGITMYSPDGPPQSRTSHKIPMDVSRES